MNAQQQLSPEQQAAQDAMQEMPIVLSLTLRKANYILNILAKLPYEQSFQPIADIQQMVVTQVQAAQAQAQADAAAAVAAAQAPAEAVATDAPAANDSDSVVVETVTYPDGTQATGTAPLPKDSPVEAPVETEAPVVTDAPVAQ